MFKPKAIAMHKGRADMARPLLCLCAASAAFWALAATAHAEPPKELTLSGILPRSSEAAPANSVTPHIRGSEDGVGKSVVRFGPMSPIAAVGNPTNVVRVFTNPQCEGAPAGEGSYDELEGDGIEAEVAPDSVTTFYANQAEPGNLGEPSPCSKNGVTYYESSTAVTPPSEPPPADGGSPPATERPASPNAPIPPRLRTIPGSRANDNAPSIVGIAPGASQVKIFSNSGCAGAPVAVASPAELAAGVAVRVPDNSVTDFTAISTANGKQSFCSTPATYIEDSTPPHVRITMGPGVKTRRHKAVFRFADVGEEPTGTSFRCRLNRGKWKACHSPFKIKHLHFRRYVLSVSATDEVGNTGAKPVKRSFKVIH